MFKKAKIAFAALFSLSLCSTAAVINTSAVADLPNYINNARGNYEDFDFELWNQNSEDNVSMTLTGGGTFRCRWDAENVLFRTGMKLGSNKTYAEYGDITIDYSAEYEITKGDVSYLCVYGWTEDPMIEFYVIESYGNYKPGTDFKGRIEVDGGVYDVYEATRVEQPSIQGTKTFRQYFSIRVDKRTEGTISMAEHFKAWEELGMDMSGVMYEVSLCVEGYRSSGTAKILNHMLTVGDNVFGTFTELENEDILETNEAAITSEVTVNSEVTQTDDIIITDDVTVTDEAEQPAALDVNDTDEDESESNNTIFIILIVIGVLLIGACIIMIVNKSKKK